MKFRRIDFSRLGRLSNYSPISAAALLAAALLAAALLVGVTACGSDDDHDDLEDADFSQLVKFEQALANAEAAVPDGIAIEAELEIEDDDDEVSEYEFEFFKPTADEIAKVDIEAVGGAVLNVKVKDGKRKKRARLAAANIEDFIGLSGALAASRAQVAGFPIEVELELEDDEPDAYEVLIYSQERDELTEIEIDARTGEVLEIEVEDD